MTGVAAPALSGVPGAHVFELRAGKVVRLEIFADRDRAIASVRAHECEQPISE